MLRCARFHLHWQVVLMADGQITAGSKVVKPNARKLRRLATEPVPSLGGFAGARLRCAAQIWRLAIHWLLMADVLGNGRTLQQQPQAGNRAGA
jgi:ATP-dependent protease HslVU (ClpYQ) peptidase subunit